MPIQSFVSGKALQSTTFFQRLYNIIPEPLLPYVITFVESVSSSPALSITLVVIVVSLLYEAGIVRDLKHSYNTFEKYKQEAKILKGTNTLNVDTSNAAPPNPSSPTVPTAATTTTTTTASTVRTVPTTLTDVVLSFVTMTGMKAYLVAIYDRLKYIVQKFNSPIMRVIYQELQQMQIKFIIGGYLFMVLSSFVFYWSNEVTIQLDSMVMNVLPRMILLHSHNHTTNTTAATNSNTSFASSVPSTFNSTTTDTTTMVIVIDENSTGDVPNCSSSLLASSVITTTNNDSVIEEAITSSLHHAPLPLEWITSPLSSVLDNVLPHSVDTAILTTAVQLILLSLSYDMGQRMCDKASDYMFFSANAEKAAIRRRRYLRNLLLQETVFYSKVSSRALAEEVQKGAETLDTLIMQNIPNFIRALLNVITATLACLRLDLQLSLFVFMMNIINIASFLRQFNYMSSVYRGIMMDRSRALNSKLSEAFTHIELVQITAAEEFVVQDVREATERYHEVEKDALWPLAIESWIIANAQTIFSRLTWFCGLYRAIYRTPMFTVAEFTAFQRFARTASPHTVIKELELLLKGISACERYVRLRSRKSAVDMQLEDENPSLENDLSIASPSAMAKMVMTSNSSSALSTSVASMLQSQASLYTLDKLHKSFPWLQEDMDTYPFILNPMLATAVLPTEVIKNHVNRRFATIVHTCGRSYRHILRGEIILQDVEFSYPDTADIHAEDMEVLAVDKDIAKSNASTGNNSVIRRRGRNNRTYTNNSRGGLGGSTTLGQRSSTTFLDERNKMMYRSNKVEPSSPSMVSDLTIDSPSLVRPSSNPKILDGVSVTIGAGKMVAIVGANGAGKSTLCRLLARFYDPDKGSILYDGYDLRHYAPRTIRRCIGYVQQDAHILRTYTVRENLYFGLDLTSENLPTEEEMITVTKQVGIHDRIMKLPQGYDTVIKEPVTLSDGEKQKLALSRALLRDPAIMIVDEGTSNLDPPSANKIIEILKTSGKEKSRTTVIIAHRISTVVKADLIIYLENGKIIESGTHKELLQRTNGRYSNFIQSQLMDGEGNTGVAVLMQTPSVSRNNSYISNNGMLEITKEENILGKGTVD